MSKSYYIPTCLFSIFLLISSYSSVVIAETPKQLYDAAIAAGQEGHCNDAVRLLTNASDKEPQNMSIATLRSMAIDCLEGKVPKDTSNYILESTASGNSGDWITALSLAQKACASAPKYAPAYVHLGVVYAQMVLANKGDNYAADSIRAYSKAIEIDPNNGFAHYNIGVAYAAQRKWDLAKKHLSQASSLNVRVPSEVISRINKESEKSNKGFFSGLFAPLLFILSAPKMFAGGSSAFAILWDETWGIGSIAYRIGFIFGVLLLVAIIGGIGSASSTSKAKGSPQKRPNDKRKDEKKDTIGTENGR